MYRYMHITFCSCIYLFDSLFVYIYVQIDRQMYRLIDRSTDR